MRRALNLRSLPTDTMFAAGAREIIDELKACAPIWKVEVEGDQRRRVEGEEPKRRQD